MKRNDYITPECETVSIDSSLQLLAGSTLEIGISSEDATEAAYAREYEFSD